MKISNTESDAFIVTIDELTQKNEALLGALEQLHEKCTLLLEVISNDTAWTVSQMTLRSKTVSTIKASDSVEEFAVDRMTLGGSVND